jgi:hypothetical protein
VCAACLKYSVLIVVGKKKYKMQHLESGTPVLYIGHTVQQLHHHVLVSSGRTAFRFGVCDVWRLLLAGGQAVNLIQAHGRVL